MPNVDGGRQQGRHYIGKHLCYICRHQFCGDCLVQVNKIQYTAKVKQFSTNKCPHTQTKLTDHKALIWPGCMQRSRWIKVYSASLWDNLITEALGYGTHCQIILHLPSRLSTNEMNHTCLYLPRQSRSSFTARPQGMEGWVSLGSTM